MRLNHSRPILHLLITITSLLSLLNFSSAASPPPSDDLAALNTNFKPSIAVTIVVLVGAFFFVVFFSIYIRQCSNDARNGGSVRPTGVGARSNRVNRGLDPEVIEKFPTFDYSMVKGLKIGKGALECAVCLNEFEDNETLRLLPKCDHVFHPECIDAWLVSHTTCPVCRANLVPVPEEQQQTGTSTGTAPESLSQVQIPMFVTDENLVNESQEVAIIINEGESQPAVVASPPHDRPSRSKSVRNWLSGRLPRSHTTGHSLVRPGDNCERFTLRLPEEVRKDILNGKLNRTASCLVPRRQGSVSGARTIRQGSSTGWRSFNFRRSFNFSKSDRWGLSFWKANFAKSQKRGEDSIKSPVGTRAQCGPEQCSMSRSPV
ncbi:hypothetical protein GIB67_016495 [Kingdonia uniflora]|uniref:RING-type E3 ubiquitin transferase n=1 Tax=Kingdonia uniflora TaxID=39325 RepID=A0A7J7M7Z4_9MAGN|nr:hypothetical protein GIB67_016495 [Kingdonia uniflora]